MILESYIKSILSIKIMETVEYIKYGLNVISLATYLITGGLFCAFGFFGQTVAGMEFADRHRELLDKIKDLYFRNLLNLVLLFVCSMALSLILEKIGN